MLRTDQAGGAPAHAADSASACDQFVDVTVRSAEVLPGWARFTEQFYAGVAQFLDGRGQVADGEPDDRSAVEVLPALELRAEDLDMPTAGELEDPQARL